MEENPSQIGPALPPGFKQQQQEQIGPELPPGHSTAGQSSSSSQKHSSRRRSSHSSDSSGTDDSDSDSNSSSDEDPSDSEEKSSKKKTIGPILPPGALKSAGESETNVDSNTNTGGGSIGPVLPPGFLKSHQSHHSSDEEDTSFGPRPPAPGKEKTAAEEFEERARLMKHRLTHGDEEEDTTPQRESWMTELPTVGLAKHMGLQARKLGSGSTVKYEDQSVWTDTPADRLRKQQEAAEGKGQGLKRPLDDPVQSARDKLLADQVEQHNKKARADSLLEMHMKKLKKQKHKEEKKKKKEKKKKDKKNKKDKKSKSAPAKPERKPFSREDDLNVNRFDSAQRKALIKKSQQLNTKFSSGGQQFL